MNEDQEFESFLKARLEEGEALPERCHEAIARAARAEALARVVARHSSRRSGGIWLMAASLAVICLMTIVGVLSPAPQADANTIACVIDLLRESDGTMDEESSGSVADRLLAWQDEPYLAAVSGLAADSTTGLY